MNELEKKSREVLKYAEGINELLRSTINSHDNEIKKIKLDIACQRLSKLKEILIEYPSIKINIGKIEANIKEAKIRISHQNSKGASYKKTIYFTSIFMTIIVLIGSYIFIRYYRPAPPPKTAITDSSKDAHFNTLSTKMTDAHENENQPGVNKSDQLDEKKEKERTFQKIPQFKVVTHDGVILTITVKPDTTTNQLKSLINAFKEARANDSFQQLQIPPTTKGGIKGDYAGIEIFVFTEPEWATKDRLNRFLGKESPYMSEEKKWREYSKFYNKYVKEFTSHIKAWYGLSFSGSEDGFIGYAEGDTIYTNIYEKLFHNEGVKRYIPNIGSMSQEELKDRYWQLIRKVYPEKIVLVAGVEVITSSKKTLMIRVKNTWHHQPYQIRMQNAQTFWELWAKLRSPSELDAARIVIVDLNGNEVGGSRVIAGSAIWIKKN
jgi:hypothetical protein